MRCRCGDVRASKRDLQYVNFLSGVNRISKRTASNVFGSAVYLSIAISAQKQPGRIRWNLATVYLCVGC